jgi:hypothetical protein
VNVCLPEVPVGRIEGRVVTGDVVFEGEIVATRFEEDGHRGTRFRAETDTTGRYALDLPAGRYTVQLRLGSGSYWTVYDYTSSGPGYGQVRPDTLAVDGSHSPSAIDFNFGALTLDLKLSSRLDGESGKVVLHPKNLDAGAGGRSAVWAGVADITAGRLQVVIPGVLPDDYQVEIVLGERDYMCYCPYGGEHFWMPGIRDRAASPWYSIGEGSAVHLTASVATEPARLEGRISGAWLDMGFRPEPEIALFSPDSVVIMPPRRVAGDGSFAVDVHLPGPVKMMVLHSGLEHWVGGPGFGEAAVYDLTLGQTIAGVEVVQCGIHFLLDGDFGLSWNTEFQIYDAEGQHRLAVMRYDGGSNYHLGVPNLWPGEFLVFLTPGSDNRGNVSWRPQWWDRAASVDQARRIRLDAAGDIVALDLRLETGGTVSGSVDVAGAEDWRYYIYAVPTNDPAVDRTFRRSNHNGVYQIQGLPDGGFKIGILPVSEPFAGPATPGMVWYPGTGDWYQAAVLTVEEAGAIIDIDFQVP